MLLQKKYAASRRPEQSRKAERRIFGNEGFFFIQRFFASFGFASFRSE
jgi:hypothetical protein